jgi:hypothetical protein
VKVSTRTERRRRKALQKLLLNNEQVFIEWNKLIKVNWPLNSLPAQRIEQAATTCKDSNCNICAYLFPNVNIKYRPCYNSINIRNVLEKEPYFNIDISPVIIYKKPYKAIKREIPKKNHKLIFKDWQPAAIKKQPAQSKQQALMIKHYKGFTNKGKEFGPLNTFPFIGLSKYNNKPGICSGSSFFPFYKIISNQYLPVLKGNGYYMPWPQLDDVHKNHVEFYESLKNRSVLRIDKKQVIRGISGKTKARYFKRQYYLPGHKETLKERKYIFNTMYGDIEIIEIKRRQVDQAITQPLLYCKCGIRLTTTGACSRVICPLFSNNLLYRD